MHKKSSKSGKFTVRVHPNIDYAFIVAIILILDGKESQRSLKSLKAISTATNILDNLGQS